MPPTPSFADGPGAEEPGPRRRSRRAFVALVVVSLAIPAVVLALILHARGPSAGDAAATNGPAVTPRRARIGSLAPDFVLPGLDGRPVTLSSFRGRPVVLSFFASWCHPCEEDMPILERAQHDNGDRIVVLGVNYLDFPDDTRAFVHRLGVTFPTLIEDSTDNPVARRYDVHAMPDTIFIDARGVVRDRRFGNVSRHDLESAVGALAHG